MSPQKQNLWLFHGADSNPEQSITILRVYHRATIAIFFVIWPNTSKVFTFLRKSFRCSNPSGSYM